MNDRAKEGSSYGFLPLLLLVGLIIVYLGSLFALINIVALRDTVFGEFQPLTSPRQSLAINMARRIKGYWPLFPLPVLAIVVVHLLVKKSQVKVMLYLVLMAVIMILTIVVLALLTRLPVRVSPETPAIVIEGGIFL